MFVLMNKVLGHILCGFILILFPINAFCGTNGKDASHIDTLLTRFEYLCEKCMGLKDAINNGKKISRSEALYTIDDFVAMNVRLKADIEMMTPEQKILYERVKLWFSTGKKPKALADRRTVPTELPPMSGIAAKETNENRSIEYMPDMHHNPPKSVSHKTEYLVLGSISLPEPSYGVIAGIIHRNLYKKFHWGGYAGIRSNFTSVTHKYSCNSAGSIGNGLQFWSNGNSETERFAVTCGLLAGITKWLNLYCGVGYGLRDVFWQDIDGEWAIVKDMSHSGFSTELGAIASWKHLALGIGVSTTAFKTSCLDLSIGVNF